MRLMNGPNAGPDRDLLELADPHGEKSRLMNDFVSPLQQPSRRDMFLWASAQSAVWLTSCAQPPVARPLDTYDGFADPTWPSPRWLRFRSSQYDLWDPATVVTVQGQTDATLMIDLPRFTASHPNHVKALMLSTRAFDIRQAAGFTVRVRMQTRINGTEQNRFGLAPGDVRLAAGSLVVIDPDTGMVFDFFVSNDRIRPLYERLPVARGAFGDYPAFTILGDVAPTRPGEWHTFEIRYRRDADRVEWWLDGILLQRQERVGAPPGEAGPLVKLRQPRIGGGLFTLLDDLANDRARADDQPRTPGFIRTNWEDRFGQGGHVAFRKFEFGIEP